MTDLPFKIKRLRELLRFSQEYMAAELGLSQRGYSKIESGQCGISVARLYQIAALLQCPPDHLLTKPVEELMIQQLADSIK
jgi:transcriptional regulator with XRE-family HTH domain